MKPLMGFKQAKALFFDRKAVVDATDKATANVLSKFGAFVRQRAKSSIRRPGADRDAPKIRNAQGRLVFRRLRVSKPGSPPFSHTGLLKNFIFFTYDPLARSVVIGPTLINKPTGAPEALEYGGVVKAPWWWKSGKNKLGRIKIDARPYMRPAFEAERPKLPQMWKDSIRP